jgi:hypothetical protein
MHDLAEPPFAGDEQIGYRLHRDGRGAFAYLAQLARCASA